MRPVRDHSALFTLAVACSWLVLVAAPLEFSLWRDASLLGVPAIGIIVWLALIRFARRLSPAARADAMIRDGRFEEALSLCDTALSVGGAGAWQGRRRLVWLNRKTDTLLLLGRSGEALACALQAVEISADAETLANGAMALLRLNRYDEAASIARLVRDITRERSVSANVVLAYVYLAQNKPGEAEAAAQAVRFDVRTLLPLVRPARYALGLTALVRAERMQGKQAQALQYLEDLMRTGRQDASVRPIVLVEEAEMIASSETDAERAMKSLERATELAPDYVAWYVSQAGTFPALRNAPRFATQLQWAAQRIASQVAVSPSPEAVASVLASAGRQASGRPTHQSSVAALVVQVITLVATLALLIFWTWHFFVAGG